MTGKTLISCIPTGRQWGDKREPKLERVTIAGVRHQCHSCDVWEGGDGEDQSQQYWRMTTIDLVDRRWDEKKPVSPQEEMAGEA